MFLFICKRSGHAEIAKQKLSRQKTYFKIKLKKRLKINDYQWEDDHLLNQFNWFYCYLYFCYLCYLGHYDIISFLQDLAFTSITVLLFYAFCLHSKKTVKRPTSKWTTCS